MAEAARCLSVQSRNLCVRVHQIDEESPRVVHVQNFGGPGCDSLAFAAPDIVHFWRNYETSRDVFLAALRAALPILVPDPPLGLQVGCVPASLHDPLKDLIVELLPSLRCVAQVGRARPYAAPADTNQRGGREDDSTPFLASLQLERIDSVGHVYMAWLKQSLRGRYPEEYLELLASSDSLMPPLVVLAHDSDGQLVPVAHVVQEAGDFSVGALYVDDAFRGRGVGSWLLCQANLVISESLRHSASTQRPDTDGLAETAASWVASLVEKGNETATRTHTRAGWKQETEDLLWLVFMGTR